LNADIYQHYGVRQNFRVIYLPCVDAIAWFPEARWAFWLQTATFLIALLVWLPFQRFHILFSRDLLLMAALVWVVPRKRLVYEVHTKARLAHRLQKVVMGRVQLVVSLTGAMAAQLQAPRYIVAHDGVRPERFQDIPNISQVRARSEEHTSELQSRENLVCRLL